MSDHGQSEKSLAEKFHEWNHNPSKYPKRTGAVMAVVVFVIVAIGDFLTTYQRLGVDIKLSIVSGLVLGFVVAIVTYFAAQSAITGNSSGNRGGGF
ncbi:hypothetical protein A4G99_10985 [Haladaptatus sp. R4]|uniref:hypothetical protein n=1 Tax=Haladaptatus sp. R4 TaxID=1679489 RepID=UPI0007B48AEE|nr:hypothetical protein [Haladaptatus sp. R4]KZN24839.1 hypothetical protein A4G99_10985 [Haladaptatus sp. R4]